MKRRFLKKGKIFDREIPKKGIEIGHEIGKTNRYRVTDKNDRQREMEIFKKEKFQKGE